MIKKYKNKEFKMNRKSLLLVISIAAISQAASAVPFTFKAGEAASAQQVNDNFKSLEDRLTVYDYRNFSRADTITEKTFSTTTSAGINCFPVEVRQYKNTPAGENTEIVVTRIRKDALDKVCQYHEFNYLNTPTERRLLNEVTKSSDGVDVTGTMSYDSYMVVATASMIKGMTFGSGSTLTFDPAITGQSVHMTNYVALGLDDVKVPANSYTGCLKMSVAEAGAMRISWFCAGVGEVKRIRKAINVTSGTASYVSRTWVLESYK